ncbi:hypothetical protein Ancab_007430 [Ancistrocladus abbreviatus]
MAVARIAEMIAVLMALAILGAPASGQLPRTTAFQTKEGPSSTPMATGFFILGDSSVDCGDNTLFYPLLHNNLSLLPCDNESDHTLLPHFLAAKMGLPRTPTFYGQNATIQGLLSGLNFGSAMATILLMNPSSPNFQSLNQQLRQVIDTIQLLQLQLGQSTANQYVKSSIFYLSFGKDDYIHFLSNTTTYPIRPKDNGHTFARILVDQMVEVMRDLYDANVRKIICMGILPLGCAPRTVFEWRSAMMREIHRSGCISEVNQLIFEYNKLLKEKIVDLSMELPQLYITYCDIYQSMTEILAKPRSYGFVDARSACCGLGWLGAGVGCLSMSMACSHSSSHVWWDLYNPTKAVNSLLADSAWSGHPFTDLCYPMTVEDLVYAS